MRTGVHFRDEERRKIADAIREAESRTSGEIVAMVVGQSWSYPRAEFLGASFMTLLGTLLVSLIVPLESAPRVILAELVLFTVSLAFLRRVPGVKRLFIQKEFLRECVQRRAVHAFHEHGLDRTKHSNGILIMLSLFERDVEILAGRGIDDRVPRGTWDRTVAEIVRGIREGKAAGALTAAVGQVGDILAAEFPVTPDDVDELRNHLIVTDD